MPAPLPPDEAERLETLYRYDILDTDPEETFDRITYLAARLFDVPIVLVSLVDADRQWFKACYGLDLRETSRDLSFCAYAILDDEVLIVPNALEDARFQNNDLVTGPLHVRFYAGAPIQMGDGAKLGTVCLLDTEPRPPLTEEQVGMLEGLAALVANEIELRRALTEERRAVAAQRASEARLSAIYNSTTVGISVVDQQGHLVDANQAYARLLGYGEGELIGKSFSTVIAPEALAEAQRQFGAFLQGEPAITGEWSMLRKDGNLLDVYVTASPLKLASGEQHLVTTVTDLTLLKQAQARLHLLESAVVHANDAILITEAEPIDLPGPRIIYVNDAFTRMTGYTAEEVIGKTPRLLQGPKSDRAMLDRIRRALSRWRPVKVELVNYHKDGSEFWVEFDIVPVANAAGWFTHWVSIQRNVTDRRRADEAVRENEALLRSVVTNVPVVLFAVDARGTLTFLQGKGVAALGIQPGYGVGRPVQEVLQTQPALLQSVERALTGEAFSLELKVAGRTLEMTFSPMRSADGELAGTIGIANDVSERRAAAEQLFLLERAISVTAEGICISSMLEPDEPLIYVNSGFEELTGYAREEVLGYNCRFLQGPDTDPAAVAAIRAALRGGQPLTLELLNYRKDGRPFWNRLSLTPLHNEAGVLTHYIGVQTDVTERRQAEAAMSESEERYRTLVELSPETIVVHRQGQVVYINQAGVAFVGASSPEEVVGRPIANFFRPDALERVWKNLLEHGENSGKLVEGTIYRRDGEPRDIEVLSTSIAYQGEPARQDIVRDITERRRAERALRESEGRFRATFEQAAVGIGHVDFAGRWLRVNHRLTEIVGYSEAELLERTFQQITFHEDLHADVQKVRQLMAGQRDIYTIEKRYVRKNGELIWVNLTVSLVRDDDGTPDYMVKVVEDITERKQVQAELERAKEEAEQANRAKSDFLSRMSHELRTPLNAILGFGQLLEMDLTDPDEQESIGLIMKSGRHLLGLINEVLDIARIEADRLPFSLEPVSLNDALSESLDLLGLAMKRRDIRLERGALERSNYYVMADRQRLKQVLLNLLSNAVKFNREGGTVRLSATLSAEGRVVCLNVQDTGEGIAPEQLGRLFTPFERLDADRAGIEGTGLGLVLSQRLVEAMGGALRVESTVGTGSTFRVCLPLAHEATLHPDFSEDAVEEAAGRARAARTVLYIEDNLSNLRLVESILARRPAIRLLSAMQGSLGLEVAKAQKPDLILLDLHLPDMPGQTLLRHLQEEESTQHIPVVIVSADAIPSHIERILDEGASGFLTKPLDVRAFLSLIDTL